MNSPDPVKTRSARLTRLLVAKFAFDFLFLIAVVIAYGYSALPPPYRGWTDGVTDGVVSGWVCNADSVDSPVEVQLFMDNKFAGSTTTGLERGDILTRYPAMGRTCGFRIEMRPLAAGEHSLRVFAVDISGMRVEPTFRQIGQTLTWSGIEPK